MTHEVRITVKTERTLLLPTLPNFLRTPNEQTVDVGELTEEQVREIGAKWTEELVRKSRARRHDQIAALNRELKKSSGCEV